MMSTRLSHDEVTAALDRYREAELVNVNSVLKKYEDLGSVETLRTDIGNIANTGVGAGVALDIPHVVLAGLATVDAFSALRAIRDLKSSNGELRQDDVVHSRIVAAAVNHIGAQLDSLPPDAEIELVPMPDGGDGARSRMLPLARRIVSECASKFSHYRVFVSETPVLVSTINRPPRRSYYASVEELKADVDAVQRSFRVAQSPIVRRHYVLFDDLIDTGRQLAAANASLLAAGFNCLVPMTVSESSLRVHRRQAAVGAVPTAVVTQLAIDVAVRLRQLAATGAWSNERDTLAAYLLANCAHPKQFLNNVARCDPHQIDWSRLLRDNRRALIYAMTFFIDASARAAIVANVSIDDDVRRVVERVPIEVPAISFARWIASSN